jgi:hypothetical protein
MFPRVKIKKPFPAIAVMQRLSYHHLAVEKTLFGDLAHHHPEMPICAVHHGRHTESPGGFPI